MPTPFVVPVSSAGMLAAVACVVSGGPLFAEGLRALRVRRLLAALPSTAPEPGRTGFVRVPGQVVLESPLFSPLSQRPCAAYRLEVLALDGSAGGSVGQSRNFRLVTDSCAAIVAAEGGEWTMPVTAEREVAAGEQVSANMAALLDGDSTLRWLRDRRAPMRIVERSVEAGSHVEVLGWARATDASDAVAAEVFAATGTDGAVVAVAQAPADRPALRIAGADPLELRVIATGDADTARLAPPQWRAWGVLVGPLLSLAGLMYLAHALESTLAGRL
jgi:hypothetical protein